VEPWQPLQFTLGGWFAPFMLLWIAGGIAVTIHQSRKERFLERILQVVAALCVFFAFGEAAAFHLGTQANEWMVVGGVLIVAFALLYGLLVLTERNAKKQS
jgi:small neutral amino acid transporter SnatA (MarC family)